MFKHATLFLASKYAGAPLQQVPWVSGNPSILEKARQNANILRKPSLNFNNSYRMQNPGTRQLKFLTEPLYACRVLL